MVDPKKIIIPVNSFDYLDAERVLVVLGEKIGGVMVDPLIQRIYLVANEARERNCDLWLNACCLTESLTRDLVYINFVFEIVNLLGQKKGMMSPALPIKGIITFCRPEVMTEAVRLKRELFPETDQPKPLFYGVTWATTGKNHPPIETIYQDIQRRARRAAKIGYDGVQTPAPYAEIAKKYQLQLMIAGIRYSHELTTVPNDDQQITSTPQEAALTQAEHYLIGRPVIDREPELWKEALSMIINLMNNQPVTYQPSLI